MRFYEKSVFPFILDKQMNKENYQRERNITLPNATGSVLEIGFGTGLNLPHYPDHVNKIVALDINPGMNAKAQKRMLESGLDVEYHCLNTENLPFETSLFDTVISTWTLCSITDLHSALLEIHRVLKPNGKFIFLEHGLAENPRMQTLQNWITPIQKVIACGCHLNRKIDASIKQAGFEITNLERFIMEGASSPLAGSMYRGIAYPV